MLVNIAKCYCIVINYSGNFIAIYIYIIQENLLSLKNRNLNYAIKKKNSLEYFFKINICKLNQRKIGYIGAKIN